MTLAKSVSNATRFNEWRDTKLAFFFIFFAIYYPSSNFFQNIYELISGLIFVSVCLSLGHIANNISDISQDLLAGKIVVNLKIQRAIFIVLIILLLVYSVHYTVDLTSFLIIIFSFFLGTSYSKKPFRFKERGLLGIIVGGISQRILPLLPIAYYWKVVPSVWLYFCVLFFISFRQMIVHQIKDYQNDLDSHTNTFVTDIGISTSKIIVSTISIIEMSTLIKWLIDLSNIFPLVVFLIFLALLACKATQKSTYWQKLSLTSSSRYPLSDFYFLLLPILSCLFVSPPLTYIYLILVIIFQKYFLSEFVYIFRR